MVDLRQNQMILSTQQKVCKLNIIANKGISSPANKAVVSKEGIPQVF